MKVYTICTVWENTVQDYGYQEVGGSWGHFEGWLL